MIRWTAMLPAPVFLGLGDQSVTRNGQLGRGPKTTKLSVPENTGTESFDAVSTSVSEGGLERRGQTFISDRVGPSRTVFPGLMQPEAGTSHASIRSVPPGSVTIPVTTEGEVTPINRTVSAPA